MGHFDVRTESIEKMFKKSQEMMEVQVKKVREVEEKLAKSQETMTSQARLVKEAVDKVIKNQEVMETQIKKVQDVASTMEAKNVQVRRASFIEKATKLEERESRKESHKKPEIKRKNPPAANHIEKKRPRRHQQKGIHFNPM